MGVPGLANWLVAQCPAAQTDFLLQNSGGPSKQHKCECLYVDVPQWMHTCLRGATTRRQVYSKLFRRLDSLLNGCAPSKSIVMAMDGVAPLAKLLTQRQRRLAEDRRGTTSIAPKAATDAYMGRPGLTPGCLLLAEFQDALSGYVATRLVTGRFPGVHIELSGSDAPGEAELKLLDRMMRPWADVQPGDRHIVAAGDSDLALMACFLPASMNVSLLREDSSPKSTAWKLFSLSKLSSKWQHKHAFMQGDDNLQAAKRDLAFLAIVGSGNDYVPCLQPPLDRLWPAYIRLRERNEWQHRHLVHQAGTSISFDAQLLLALLQTVHDSHASFQSHTPAPPGPVAGDYLEAVRWVLEMYASGTCADWRFSFRNRAPLTHWLMQHLQQAIAAPGQAKGAVTLVPPAHAQQLQAQAMVPVSPAAFAMSLLGPRLGRNFVPSALQHLMQPPSPIAHLYHVCDECDRLRLADRSSQLALAQARKAEEAGVKAKLAPERQEQLRSKVHSLQSRVRNATQASQAHSAAAHPSEPFPVDSVEAAVASIASSAYPAHERRLLQFGPSFCYWALGNSRPSPLTNVVEADKRKAQHIATPLTKLHGQAANLEQRRLHRMALPTPALRDQHLPLKWERVTVDVVKKLRDRQEHQQKQTGSSRAASTQPPVRAVMAQPMKPQAAEAVAAQRLRKSPLRLCLERGAMLMPRQPRLACLL